VLTTTKQCAAATHIINHSTTAPFRSFNIKHFHKLGRKLTRTIEVFHDPYGLRNQIPNNRCLSSLLGAKSLSDCSLDFFLAVGIHQDHYVDLDTSALAPILDSFRYRARVEASRLRHQLQTIETFANDREKIDV
jgi:hypothetical protein